jgi:hypothetical protein
MHAVQSAIQVARVLGQLGALQVEARESYWKRAGGGRFGPIDLAIGETLLIDAGVVEQRDGFLAPLIDLDALLGGEESDVVAILCARTLSDGADPAVTSGLDALIPDEHRRTRLQRAAARRFEDAQMKLVGQIGEELVAAACRQDLRSLGRADLGRRVRHVSLEDDTAGYDILAPRLAGRGRMLEVKSTTELGDPVKVYLSRHESSVAAREETWSLVVCVGVDPLTRTGQILGWLPGSGLGEYLPHDRVGGTWETVRITLIRSSLVPGLPSPIQ